MRVQAIKRRLDEGEALGSRAAAGRGTTNGSGSDTQTRDGRDSGSCAAAELASGAGGGRGRGRGRHGRVSAAASGADRRVGQTDGLSLKDGRLRENKFIIAPSHPEDSQRGGSGGGDTHGSGRRGSGRSEGSGASSGGDCENRSEGSGGNIGGTSSSDSGLPGRLGTVASIRSPFFCNVFAQLALCNQAQPKPSDPRQILQVRALRSAHRPSASTHS